MAGSLVLTNGLGIGPSGATPGLPTVTNLLPTAGTPVEPTTVIQFDVVDVEAAFREILIVISFDGGVTRELLYDADGFNPAGYVNASNTKTTIANGFHFTILRDGGWRGPVWLKVYAIDITGVENT